MARGFFGPVLGLLSFREDTISKLLLWPGMEMVPQAGHDCIGESVRFGCSWASATSRLWTIKCADMDGDALTYSRAAEARYRTLGSILAGYVEEKGAIW